MQSFFLADGDLGERHLDTTPLDSMERVATWVACLKDLVAMDVANDILLWSGSGIVTC